MMAAMKVKDIAFTGYPVTNMRRARDFYEKILGLSPTVYELEKGASWVEYELSSGTLAITDVDPNWQPRDNGPSIALEVDDIDSAMEHLKSHHVKICIETIDSPVCQIGAIQDSEGNMITIHSKKPCHPENTVEASRPSSVNG